MKMVMIKKLAMTVAVAVAAALAVACSSKEDKAAGVEGESGFFSTSMVMNGSWWMSNLPPRVLL